MEDCIMLNRDYEAFDKLNDTQFSFIISLANCLSEAPNEDQKWFREERKKYAKYNMSMEEIDRIIHEE